MSPRSADPPTGGVPRRLYTVTETANQLGLGRTKVYELINRGRLRSVNIDSARRVSTTAIDDDIEELEGGVCRQFGIWQSAEGLNWRTRM